MWQLVVNRAEAHVVAWCVAAVAVGISVPVSRRAG
jgi:hypothetical protein